MDFDKKESSTYLDGVPMTICAKFCPPRSVSVPLAFTSCFPLDLLEEEYDFSLEKKVLEAAAKQKAIQEELATKAKGVKVTSEIESFTQGSSLEASCEKTTKLNPRENSASTSAQAWPHASILQPQLHHKTSENGTLQYKDSSKSINLSDFENDTSSPFDYMELQTINDFEELSTVFQGLNETKVIASIPKSSDKDKTDKIYSSLNFSVPSTSISTESKDVKVDNFLKSNCYSVSQNTNSMNSNKAHCSSTNSAYCDLHSERLLTSHELNGSNPLGLSPNAAKPLDYASIEECKTQEPSVTWGKSSGSFSVLYQAPNTTSVTYEHSLNNQCDYSVSKGCNALRSSKSVSDLCNLPVTESATPSSYSRSHTPPPNMMSSNHGFESSHIEEILAKNSLHESHDNGSFTDLPDPYDELSSEERLFVDSITDMGFLRSQVARTVKHMGVDDKKVVEHLCQIQMLEESGYDSLEAEAALHLHDYNRDEAKKYLDLLTQIQGLGFEKTAIKKALVQNKNDMDKAINALLL